MNIAATRIHTNGGQFNPDIAILQRWCHQAIAYADELVVATDRNLFEQVQQCLKQLPMTINLVLVDPWIGYTLPLNALLKEATRLQGKTILIQSLEVQSKASHIRLLQQHLTDDTLVVGAKLTEKHGESRGLQDIHALNSPWNTLALWDLDKLNVTGFTGVNNGLLDGVPGGMEEVITISLLQHLYPQTNKSKLIQLPHLHWDIIWNDRERHQYHEIKMASKYRRAEIQLEYFQHPRGRVEVI